MEPGQELPPPSPELVTLRVLTEAHFRMLKPKDRLRFQQSVFEVLQEMDDEPVRIRQAVDHAALKVARCRAKSWLGQVIRDIVRRGGI